MRITPLLIGSICYMLMVANVAAHTQVVVIPVDDEAAPVPADIDGPPAPALPGGENLVNVSPLGNGDYDDLADAMASITNASASRPYLVLLAPGEYELDAPLQIKPYVSIRGAGEEATLIRGQVGATGEAPGAALISMATGSTLSRVRLHNLGNGVNGNASIGVYSNCAGCQLLETEILLDSTANRNFGIYSSGQGLQVNLTEVLIDATGSVQQTGVYDNGSDGEYHRLQVEVKGGIGSCALEAASGSGFTLRDSSLDIDSLVPEALRINSGSGARLVNTRIEGSVPVGGGHCFHVFTPAGLPLSC